MFLDCTDKFLLLSHEWMSHTDCVCFVGRNAVLYALMKNLESISSSPRRALWFENPSVDSDEIGKTREDDSELLPV